MERVLGGVSVGFEGGFLGDFSMGCMLSVCGVENVGRYVGYGVSCWIFAPGILFSFILDAPAEVARQARNDGFFRRLL